MKRLFKVSIYHTGGGHNYYNVVAENDVEAKEKALFSEKDFDAAIGAKRSSVDYCEVQMLYVVHIV